MLDGKRLRFGNKVWSYNPKARLYPFVCMIDGSSEATASGLGINDMLNVSVEVVPAYQILFRNKKEKVFKTTMAKYESLENYFETFPKALEHEDFHTIIPESAEFVNEPKYS